MILVEMPEIEAAIAEESWEWLQDNAPKLATAVRAEAARGRTPEQVRRFVLAKVGLHRLALAVRCEQAAAHLVAERAT